MNNHRLTAIAFSACASLSIAVASAADDQVGVTVSTTLQSKGFNAHYRPELALSGNDRSFFLSAGAPRTSDDFTVTFDRPIHVSRISVKTGVDKLGDELTAGNLEVSEDGVQFKKIASFEGGVATSDEESDGILAIRIQPTIRQDHPLAIQHIAISTSADLRRPTRVPRIIFDSTRAPELADWGLKATKVAQDAYPMLLKALPSKDFIGPNFVRIWFNPRYRGVAATGNDTIEISPTYVQAHQNDFGMVVHELSHAIQHYTRNNNAGWLVEGISDYVRFYLYEPLVPRPRINPDKATYHDAYRTTAAFLAYAQAKYDHNLVVKLDDALRSGSYNDSLFKKYTGKEPQEIWNELIADLRSGKTKLARL